MRNAQAHQIRNAGSFPCMFFLVRKSIFSNQNANDAFPVFATIDWELFTWSIAIYLKYTLMALGSAFNVHRESTRSSIHSEPSISNYPSNKLRNVSAACLNISKAIYLYCSFCHWKCSCFRGDSKVDRFYNFFLKIRMQLWRINWELIKILIV